MSFIDTKIEKYTNPLGNIKKYYHCRAKLFSKCPACLKHKRNFIKAFDYLDYEKEWLQETKLRQPVCLVCFSEEYEEEILRRYYDDD